MTKKLIIFATYEEAEPSLKKLNAQPVLDSVISHRKRGNLPICYNIDQGLIVLANIGIHAAQHAVSRYHFGCDEILNIGIAGALSKNFSIGTMIEIEKIGKHVFYPKDLDNTSKNIVQRTIPSFTLQGKGGRLISSDFPVHHSEQKELLSQHWDLIDMEGYGVVYAATKFGKPCRLWKIVSDFSSEGGRKLIQKHQQTLAKKIAIFLFDILN
ncbi:MAG: hypothetical protein KDK55_03710 [Chlamydiia bacterium]|nr:hypothetical protein [Chlamydiia bacterium]